MVRTKHDQAIRANNIETTPTSLRAQQETKAPIDTCAIKGIY